MSRRSYRRSRRPEPGSGCLGSIAWMGVLILILVAIYGTLLRPIFSDYLGEQAATQLAGAPISVDPDQFSGEIAEASAALPAAVAALPSGEIVILEQDVNAYISANPQSLGPLDQARVRFRSGQVIVDVQAFGMGGSAGAELVAESGQIVARNLELDGVLGLVLSGPQIVEPLLQRLNSELTRQGKTIQDVRIEEGRMVVVIG